MPDLDELCRHVALGVDHAVAVERTVIRLFVKVTAVGEELSVLPESLVDPVPDAAATERIVPVEDVPILLEVADRIPHRVGVLAEEEALALRHLRAPVVDALARFRREVAARAARLQPLDLRIHAAVHIRDVVTALPVDGTRRIGRAHRGRGVREADAVSRLIAERPHRDGRMVAVELHMPLVAFDDRVVPLLEASESLLAIGRLMSLDIRLGDDVDAVAVAEVILKMMVGVVRGAHGVDVKLLHQRDVTDHVVQRHRASA